MHLIQYASAAVGMILAPFGSVSDLVESQNPWHGFQAQGPVLIVSRIHQIENQGDCQKWFDAIRGDAPGLPIQSNQSTGWQSAWKAWEPWSKDELNYVQDCTNLPCEVKLNGAELSKLSNAPLKPMSQTLKFKNYLQTVEDRVSFYAKTQERKEYEFPGVPIDPWKFLEKAGFISSALLPAEPQLWIRKLDLAPGKIKLIRQILDRRVGQSTSGKELTVWMRDAYTDHYFDGWGEWTHAQCKTGPSQKPSLLLVQTLILELDLLKKHDLISELSRGKMKSAIEENGSRYLDKVYERLAARIAQTR